MTQTPPSRITAAELQWLLECKRDLLNALEKLLASAKAAGWREYAVKQAEEAIAKARAFPGNGKS